MNKILNTIKYFFFIIFSISILCIFNINKNIYIFANNINSENVNNISDVVGTGNTEEVKKDYMVRLKEIHDGFFTIKENEKYKKIGFDNMLFLIRSIGTNYNSEKYYNKVLEYLSSKSDQKSKEYLQYIKENQFFFRIILPGIKNKEYKSNLRNPLNSQGIFQLSKLEGYLSSQDCGNDIYLYNDCSVVLELYKPQKELDENDNILQYLDMVGFVKSKFKNFELMEISSNVFGIYNQTEILLKLLKIKYTKEEIESLIKGYDFKTRNFTIDKNIQSLYDKNTLQLSSVMITKPQDMKYIVEITMYNIIGSLYSGIRNIGNIEGYGYFVYDNGYVSNNSKEGLIFYQTSKDYGTETNLVEGYGSTFFSMLYIGDEKGYSFQLNTILLIKKYFKKISFNK